MTRWLSVTADDCAGLDAEQAAEMVRARAAELADGAPHTLGSAFRDGVWWARAARYFPVYVGDDLGWDEPPPFRPPPLSEWPLHPCSPDQMMSVGMAEMAAGNWERGWRLYEWRTQAEHYKDHFYKPWPMPIWDGSPLNGRRLLVHAEQGAGDVFQFCRYLHSRTFSVSAHDEFVTFLCGRDLAPIMRRNFPWINVVTECGYEFHCHLPLMSLPVALGNYEPTAGLDDFTQPTAGPVTCNHYLTCKGELSDVAERALQPTGPHVGFCWKGSPNHKNDARRSMTFEDLLPFAPQPHSPYALCDLQKGTTWDATAALIANLDLVVSVDTAVAHLAGALGIPVKLIIPHEAEWRWAAGAKWYESMEVIKCQSPS